MTSEKKTNGLIQTNNTTDAPEEKSAISETGYVMQSKQAGNAILQERKIKNPAKKTVQIEIRKTRTFVKRETTELQSTPVKSIPDVARLAAQYGMDLKVENKVTPTLTETVSENQLASCVNVHTTNEQVTETDTQTSDASVNEVTGDDESSVQDISGAAAVSLPETRHDVMPNSSSRTPRIQQTCPPASLNSNRLYASGTSNRLALLAFVPRIPYDYQHSYAFIQAKYKPGMSLQQDTDPTIGTNIDGTWLRHRSKTVSFLETPQVKELIQLVRRSNIGADAAVYATDLADVVGRIAICFHERGLHTQHKGKPLAAVTSQCLLEICTICPLELNGCLCADNLIIVPAIIAKSNNKTLPAEETSNRYDHLLIKRDTIKPARIQRSEYFLPRMLKVHGPYDTYIFIENALQYLSFTKPEDREAPIVPLPLFGLLMRECDRLQRFRYLIPGLMALNALYSRQTGILEVIALLSLNALTLGDPEDMMRQMLHIAYCRPNKIGYQQDPSEVKSQLTEHIATWLYSVYGEDILVAPEAFEKGLYRSMFTHPPLPLHW